MEICNINQVVLDSKGNNDQFWLLYTKKYYGSSSYSVCEFFVECRIIHFTKKFATPLIYVCYESVTLDIRDFTQKYYTKIIIL